MTLEPYLIRQILRSCAAVFGVLLAIVPYGFATETLAEDAVLKGNWQEIVELLKKREANDPMERLLMGHASLATNRNNAAQLFISLRHV